MRNYFFSNEDWFKKLDWSQRNDIGDQLLDVFPASKIESIVSKFKTCQDAANNFSATEKLKSECNQKVKKIIDSFNEFISFANSKNDEVWKLITSLENLAKESDYPTNITRWVIHGQRYYLPLLNASFSKSQKIAENENSIRVCRSVKDFIIEFDEAAHLHFVFSYCPMKYKKKVYKLFKSSISICSDKIAIFENSKYTKGKLSTPSMDSAIQFCRISKDIIKSVIKSFDSDGVERAFQQYHNCLKRQCNAINFNSIKFYKP